MFHWFETRVDPFPEIPPVKPPREMLAFVLHYSRPFAPLLIFGSVLGAMVAMLQVSLFSFVGRLVDWLSTADRATFWDDRGTELIVMGVVVLVALPVLSFIHECNAHQGMMGNFPMRIRWQAHRYLLRQSMAFFEDDFAGRVATKVMQTALAVRDVLIKITEVFVYISVYFLSAIVLFAASDVRLMVPLVLWLAAYLLALRYFVPLLREVSMVQADARSLTTGRVIDSYTNINTVKMFASGMREDQYARDAMIPFLDAVYRQMRLSTLLMTTLHIMNAFLIASTAGIAIWLWQHNAVTAGAIAFAVGLVLRMQGMSQWIMWEVAGLFEQIGVVQDGIQTIARERSVVDSQVAKPLQVQDGEITYDAIGFHYGKDIETGEKGIIKDLSLTIKAGEKVGLVGRSGAGKSTLVKLLLRFYDLENGRIKVDGQDIAAVTQESLRGQIGMVTQDTSLMHRSVYDNIVYGRPDADLEAAIKAARSVQAHEFILDLEDGEGRRGYEAHVGERGVKLSGGQRQRIAIARVLLKDAPILILDEATSALDSEVEAVIQESLYTLMEGKTVIAIAHRLSTIAAMDRLVIMDEGAVVEQGTHAELIATNGIYAQLWARQSGGFLAHDATEELANTA